MWHSIGKIRQAFLCTFIERSQGDLIDLLSLHEKMDDIIIRIRKGFQS